MCTTLCDSAEVPELKSVLHPISLLWKWKQGRSGFFQCSENWQPGLLPLLFPFSSHPGDGKRRRQKSFGTPGEFWLLGCPASQRPGPEGYIISSRSRNWTEIGTIWLIDLTVVRKIEKQYFWSIVIKDKWKTFSWWHLGSKSRTMVVSLCPQEMVSGASLCQANRTCSWALKW